MQIVTANVDNPLDNIYARVDTTYIKNSSATRENEMTDQEMRDTLRGMIEDWNNLTAEQRAEANAIAAEQAAKVYMEHQINQAIGLQYDWATGEWR